ncbi:hypothetical protein Droror1_Dr00023869 [Drosera rotundifolia]
MGSPIEATTGRPKAREGGGGVEIETGRGRAARRRRRGSWCYKFVESWLSGKSLVWCIRLGAGASSVLSRRFRVTATATSAKRVQEIMVLGCELLTELRDKICCLIDGVMQKAGQHDPSGYFLVEVRG